MLSLTERGVPDGKMGMHDQDPVMHWPYGLAQDKRSRLCPRRRSDACGSNRMSIRGDIDAVSHRAALARVLGD